MSRLSNNYSPQSLIRTYDVPPFSELRLIVTGKAEDDSIPTTPTVTVKLLPWAGNMLTDSGPATLVAAGTAEMLGRELVAGRDYDIPPGCRTAIYTWGGCKLEIRGPVTQEYQSPNMAMKEYVGLATLLNARRKLAATRQQIGPRVMVCGAASSGKTSVCNILCNYAVRSSWTPMLIELDSRGANDSQGFRFLPGVIGATVVTGIDDEGPSQPICYYFGHSEAEEDTPVFMQTCKHLSAAAVAKLALEIDASKWISSDSENSSTASTSSSGFVLNAPYQASSTMLIELTDIFGIDVVAVLDNPSLKHKLSLNYHSPPVPEDNYYDPQTGRFATVVVGLPKQSGVVAVDKERLKELRLLGYRKYFSSIPRKSLNSFRVVLSSVRLVCVDSSISSTLPASARPADYIEGGGARDSPEDAKIEAFEWSGQPMSLLNAVLGLSAAPDIEHVHRSPIIDMVYVKNVEERVGMESNTDELNVENGGSFVQKDYSLDLSTFASDIGGRFLLVPSDRQLKWWSSGI